MTTPDVFALIFLWMASLAFWYATKKPKLAPVDGMEVLNSTHHLVEIGNQQVNNRLGKLEHRMEGIEKKIDLLVEIQIKPKD